VLCVRACVGAGCVCMYGCVCVYMHVFVCVVCFVYACLRVCVYMCLYLMCMYACICASVPVYAFPSVRLVCVRMHVFVLVVYVRVHAHVFACVWRCLSIFQRVLCFSLVLCTRKQVLYKHASAH
jgi:hypothetical protein